MSILHSILIIITILIVLFFGLIPIMLATRISCPHHYTPEEMMLDAKEQGSYGDYDELPKEDFIVHSYDGYALHCTYIPAESDKFIIISHGHGVNKYCSLKYLHLFREFGYNAIIYDDRGHGENKAAYTTMGKREARDLMAVIDDAYKRFKNIAILGLHGESMGASLSIMALSYRPRIQFIVADCGYGILRMLCEDQIHKMYHLPTFLVNFASIACKVIFGYRLDEVRPIDELNENEVPICFIHGANDHLTNCRHSQLMHERNKGYSELFLFENTDHADSLINDPKLYHQVVSDFLKKINA